MEVFLFVGTEYGLEINAKENCNYIFISRHQTTGPNQNTGHFRNVHTTFGVCSMHSNNEECLLSSYGPFEKKNA